MRGEKILLARALGRWVVRSQEAHSFECSARPPAAMLILFCLLALGAVALTPAEHAELVAMLDASQQEYSTRAAALMDKAALSAGLKARPGAKAFKDIKHNHLNVDHRLALRASLSEDDLVELLFVAHMSDFHDTLRDEHLPRPSAPARAPPAGSAPSPSREAPFVARKLLGLEDNAPPPGTGDRLKRQTEEFTQACPGPGFNMACLTTWRADLVILGASASAGSSLASPVTNSVGPQGTVATNALTGGVEMVIDLPTRTISFWSYEGSMFGTAFLVAARDAGIYIGVGHKGSLVNSATADAYSGTMLCLLWARSFSLARHFKEYFVCAGGSWGVGAGGRASANLIGCVSATGWTQPQWNGIKTVAFGFGLGIAHPLTPPLPSLVYSLPFYTHIRSVECRNVTCISALLSLVPPGPQIKVMLLQWLMDAICPSSGPSTAGNAQPDPNSQGGACARMLAFPIMLLFFFLTLSLSLFPSFFSVYRTFRDGAIRFINEFPERWRRSMVHAAAFRAALSDAIADMREAALRRINELKGSPETLANTYSDIPTGPGTYIKLRDCTNIEGFPEPYFECTAPPARMRTTEVGSRAPGTQRGSNLFWDWDRDPARQGYGLFFAHAADRCVSCVLRGRNTLWIDSTSPMRLRVCTGSEAEFHPYPLINARTGASVGTCHLKYKHTPRP